MPKIVPRAGANTMTKYNYRYYITFNCCGNLETVKITANSIHEAIVQVVENECPEIAITNVRRGELVAAGMTKGLPFSYKAINIEDPELRLQAMWEEYQDSLSPHTI